MDLKLFVVTLLISLIASQANSDSWISRKINTENTHTDSYGGSKLLSIDDPQLRQPSVEVTKEQIVSDNSIWRVRADVHNALNDFRKLNGYGRGLSAPQIGYNIRMIALTMNYTSYSLFNPKIIDESVETFTMWDDCYSIPNFICCVERKKEISIEFMDELGDVIVWNNCNQELSELLQHEIDHLNGILAIDRAIKPKKAIFSDTDSSETSDSSCNSEQTVVGPVVDRHTWLRKKHYYNSLVDYPYKL